MSERDPPSPATPHDLRATTIEGFVERLRATRPEAATVSVLVFTTASKDFFHGALVEVSPESLLLRQADGVEVLILRAHVVAITAATS